MQTHILDARQDRVHFLGFEIRGSVLDRNFLPTALNQA